MNLNREADKLGNKFNEKNNSDNALFKFHEKWDAEEIAADKELQDAELYLKRAARLEEIDDLATKSYSDRCDAKLAEVGGADNLLKLVDSGEWNSCDEMTEIEKEAVYLRKELFHQEWFWEHGKPYRMEDDPNAKF